MTKHYVKRWLATVLDKEEPLVTLALPFPENWTPQPPTTEVTEPAAAVDGATAVVLASVAAPLVPAALEAGGASAATSVIPPPGVSEAAPARNPIPDSGYKPLKLAIVNGMRTVFKTYFLREKVRVWHCCLAIFCSIALVTCSFWHVIIFCMLCFALTAADLLQGGGWSHAGDDSPDIHSNRRRWLSAGQKQTRI